MVESVADVRGKCVQWGSDQYTIRTNPRSAIEIFYQSAAEIELLNSLLTAESARAARAVVA